MEPDRSSSYHRCRFPRHRHRSPLGQELWGFRPPAHHAGSQAGAAGAWVSFSGFLRRSGAGEPPSGAQPACSRTLGWAPSTTPVSVGGPASQPLPRLRAGGGPAACPAGLIPSLPVLPAIRALRSPLTSSLPACLSPRCWPSHLGPPPPRLTPQTTEGPNPVQFQPKAAPRHGLPGPISRQCPFATGEGLAPERGTGSSSPGGEEGEGGGE